MNFCNASTYIDEPKKNRTTKCGVYQGRLPAYFNNASRRPEAEQNKCAVRI